jgi:penicillin-binding protein 1C
VAGTIVALDPDIPPRHQRVRLQAVGQNLRWQIDGRPLARGAQADWLPWPGRHRIQLVDARGAVQDEVRIEVRGAGVR